ncbi:MAG: MurR/RpiR family transcriptional regulator [Candidatus Sumerlaeia bacterium]
MSGDLIRIKSLRNSMSPTNKRLADYIVNNTEDVPFLSVHELANRAKVSVATVSRFANFLGYDNYKKFRTQFGKDSLYTFDGMFEAITPQDSDDEIIDKVVKGNIKSLEDTLRVLDKESLLKGADMISRAHRFLCFGIGSSGFLAKDAALRFAQLDIPSEAYSDSYQMIVHATNLKKNCVALGVSHSGRSEVTVRALEIAQNNGAFTIGISNYMRSPLHDVCDVFLCTSFPETHVEAAALSSHLAQMCLVDALYLLMARRMNLTQSKIENINKITEKNLRLAER